MVVVRRVHAGRGLDDLEAVGEHAEHDGALLAHLGDLEGGSSEELVDALLRDGVLGGD